MTEICIYIKNLGVIYKLNTGITFFSSPEHKVLKVSCCDQSMSVVLCLSFVIRLQQLFQKPSPPTPLGQWTRNLVGRIGVTNRSKIAKIILI